MVKIKLLLGLGTTAVVGGAGTAVYFGIQSGTDEAEEKKEDEKEAKGEPGPKKMMKLLPLQQLQQNKQIKNPY